MRRLRTIFSICSSGSVLFAFRFLPEGGWGKSDDRNRLDFFVLDQPTGGWVLQTAEPSRFSGGGAEAELQRFADAVLALPAATLTKSNGAPRLAFQTLDGHRMELRWKEPGAAYDGECRLQGGAVSFDSWPLFEAPNMIQKDPDRLEIQHTSGTTHQLDFPARER